MYLDGLSRALAEMRHFYDAVSAGLRSLSFWPPYQPAVARICNLLCGAGEPAYALKVAEIALSTDAEWAEAWYGKGMSLDELGRPKDALAALERATNLQRDLTEAWARKSSILLQMSKKVRESDKLAKVLTEAQLDDQARRLAQRALDAVQMAIGLGLRGDEDTRYRVVTRMNRALILSQLDRHDEALDAVVSALELEPQNAKIHHNKGNILIRARQYNAALDAFGYAIWLDPELPNPWWAMVVLLGGHFDRQAEALFAVNHLLAMDPGNVPDLLVRGCILAKLGRYQEARFWIRYAQGHENVLSLPAGPDGKRRSALDFLGPEDI